MRWGTFQPHSLQPDYAVDYVMRYLVKARVKEGMETALAEAIENGTLGKGSVAGDEYIYNMQTARLEQDGTARWIEVCFCSIPLEEERPYWERYFELISVKDAHARRNCRHENGTEPWACCDCDCTRALEEKLSASGNLFFQRSQVTRANRRKIYHTREKSRGSRELPLQTTSASCKGLQPLPS